MMKALAVLATTATCYGLPATLAYDAAAELPQAGYQPLIEVMLPAADPLCRDRKPPP